MQTINPTTLKIKCFNTDTGVAYVALKDLSSELFEVIQDQKTPRNTQGKLTLICEDYSCSEDCSELVISEIKTIIGGYRLPEILGQLKKILPDTLIQIKIVAG